MNFHYRYRLGVRTHPFNDFPLIPNYRLESHLNSFSPNCRYRYRLEMFLN